MYLSLKPKYIPGIMIIWLASLMELKSLCCFTLLESLGRGEDRSLVAEDRSVKFSKIAENMKIHIDV